ncbi:inactive disease resistance protein RPS4-like [Neltuma alba]|uniref:inactive disease resistance protein RPS4-like n=1 Tax=Neltuma alba TaxID=207710 RepID=UPI0010A4D352|nr:inactive disease resistance protein RPS4-like [Prosopis alba]
MQVDDPRYREVVNQVISYVNGLPLALELIGADLYGKKLREWESMLDGCKRIPHDKIQQILRVSYDGLQQLEKEVFLDIACFYQGSELEFVKKMVASVHDFDPDYHIAVLIMRNTNVTVLNFEGCQYIRHMPDLSGLSSLKELQLRDCKNLIEIDNSVGQLAKLETLDVCDCVQLMTFPSEMNTPSLHWLDLVNCSNLKYFPEIMTREMEIPQLSLFGTGIDQLPPSVENPTQLSTIQIRNDAVGKGIRSLKLPSSTFLLPKLGLIDVQGYEELLMEVESIICPNISCLGLTRCNISNENLQIYLSSFSNVQILDLTGSNFTILPACIEDCQNLIQLKLDECQHLIEVEKVPPSIKQLTAAACVSLSLESKKLLLSKELLASVIPINYQLLSKVFRAHLCVPGGSIPEWFDHYSKGPSISFWFRDHFPSLCICAIVQPMGNNCWVQTEVFKNDEVAYKCNLWQMTRGYDVEHIIMHYMWNFGINEEFDEHQWNHVKICSQSEYGDAVKERGIYVIRDEWTNMENIRFTDPSQNSDILRDCQGCAIEGHTATKNPFFPSQNEQQHTHSHVIRDIDSNVISILRTKMSRNS